MLVSIALCAILNTDSVDVNALSALPNLDSVLIAHKISVSDTPTVLIQTCQVPMDTLKAAFRYARLYLKGREDEAKRLKGFEHGIVEPIQIEDGKQKVFVLLCHDSGNLPEIIFRNTGELGVLELTYITSKGKVIAVQKF